MFKLYTSPGSGGFAVHAVLEEAGAKYRVVPIDTKKGDHRSAKFLKMNPAGQVPVLELPNGHVMTESAAMLIYLCDRYGLLAPAPGSPKRPDFLRWLVFMAVNTYSADLRYFYPDRYTTDPTGIEGVKGAGLVELDRNLALLDKVIGKNKFLLGPRMTAADIYLAMLAFWHPELEQAFRRMPNVARVAKAVAQNKTIAKINAFHQLW